MSATVTVTYGDLVDSFESAFDFTQLDNTKLDNLDEDYPEDQIRKIYASETTQSMFEVFSFGYLHGASREQLDEADE